MEKNKAKHLTPIKAIRRKCLDCCGYQQSEVRLCKTLDCSLWSYRMGKRPKKPIANSMILKK